MSDKIWVTKLEAAWRLGKSERTITRWVSNGKLPKREMATGVLVGLPEDMTDISPKDTDNLELMRLRVEAAQLRAELEQLTVVTDTLILQVEELRRDKERWRQQAESALMNQRLMLEVQKRRRWWPWDRGRD